MVVPLKTSYGDRVLVTDGDHLDLELRPANASIACFPLFIRGRPTVLKVRPVQLRKQEDSKGSISADSAMYQIYFPNARKEFLQISEGTNQTLQTSAVNNPATQSKRKRKWSMWETLHGLWRKERLLSLVGSGGWGRINIYIYIFKSKLHGWCVHVREVHTSKTPRKKTGWYIGRCAYRGGRAQFPRKSTTRRTHLHKLDTFYLLIFRWKASSEAASPIRLDALMKKDLKKEKRKRRELTKTASTQLFAAALIQFRAQIKINTAHKCFTQAATHQR